jgi:hypothetical protein
MTLSTTLPPTARHTIHRDALERAAEELSRLRTENVDLRVLLHQELEADGTKLITTARMFELLFSALSDNARRDLLTVLAQRFCLHCGIETDNGCSCTNDE